MLFKEYGESIMTRLQDVISTQADSIKSAAAVLADSIELSGVFHVIGTGGHSNMVAEESLWRAGSLACVNAMFEPSVNLLLGARRSGVFDQTDRGSEALLTYYDVRPKEALIIVSSSGTPVFPVTLAKEAKKRGIKTIAITSLLAKTLPNPPLALYEAADIYIDNLMPPGDAELCLQGCDNRLGPSSSVINIAIYNMLVCQTVETLRARGIEPPVWHYDAAPDSEAINKSYFDRYSKRVKHMQI